MKDITTYTQEELDKMTDEELNQLQKEVKNEMAITEKNIEKSQKNIDEILRSF